jgi:hypothetical protein
LCCGAVELLQRRLRQVKIGAEDVPENQSVKGGVMDSYLAPVRKVIADALRKRLAWHPYIYFFIVKRIRQTQYFR